VVAAVAAVAARCDVTRRAYQAEEFLSLRRTHLLQIDGKMTAQIRRRRTGVFRTLARARVRARARAIMRAYI